MTASATATEPPRAPVDEHAVTLVRGLGEPLRSFNRTGVLAPVDVHVATTLARLAGEHDPAVLLAVGLAVRAPRLQHVHVDLAAVHQTVVADEDAPLGLEALAWPETDAWVDAVGASALVSRRDVAGGGGHAGAAEGDDVAKDGDEADDRDRADGAPDSPPLCLVGTRLYLDRYWRYERRVARAVRSRAEREDRAVDDTLLRSLLARVLPGEDRSLPRAAVALAALRGLSVIAGGPGTGKTTTVAQLLAVLDLLADAEGEPLPRVALASPTGKASARVGKALAETARTLDVPQPVRARLAEAQAQTLHRLLGGRPGSRSRFGHDRRAPLPHDVVVVDEASMVSLNLMAGLLDAVRPDARLVLVGDPGQLLSVEAGAVLGELVGPATERSRWSPGTRDRLASVTGIEAAPTDLGSPAAPAAAASSPAASPPAIADSLVVLRRVYRFSGGIATLAAAIHEGDSDAALAALDGRHADVVWLAEADVTPLRAHVELRGRELLDAARAGEAAGALAALGRLQVLCAHRRGPYGVEHWGRLQQSWLAGIGFDVERTWHAGRPVIVTRNDAHLGVHNGDTGVTLVDGEGLTVALDTGAQRVVLPPARLEHVETVHAMTIHKSQGSQFDHVVVVLPGPDSPLLTRELLYTAVTRAQRRVTLVGSEEAVRAAVARRVQRASGLREALWGDVAQP